MPSELLKTSTFMSVNVVELFLPDHLDSTEFDRLNDLLSSVFANPNGRWILDLTNVQYMGSAVLGLMVNMRRSGESTQGRLALCEMSPALQKIFKACCLERLFTIARTREDALRAVR